MFTFILFAALAAAGLVGTFAALPLDGYRRLPTRHP